MADPGKDEKRKGCELTERELYEMLLMEDETLHDEGRDLYMDEVIRKIRRDLGTDGEQ